MTTEALPAPPRAASPAKVQRNNAVFFRTLKYGLLLLFLCLVLMPAYVLFVTSFKGVGDATPARAWLLPREWQLDGWKHAWEVLAPALGRTFAMVIPGRADLGIRWAR